MERDFAEDLDDVICAPNFNTFENYQDVAIVVFGAWILVAIIVYLVANFLLQNSNAVTEVDTSPEKVQENPEKVQDNEEKLIEVVKEVLTKKVEQEILFKPYIEDTLEVPKSLGSDLEAVSWIDTCLANIFGSTVLRTCLVDLWLDSMSKYIRTLDTEEDLELYFEGVLPNERNVKITNLVTQVHPSDNMTVTMDMEAKNVPIKAKVICGGQTTILTLVLKHLRGRGSITVLSHERIMNAKLEGWPEIHFEVQTGKGEMNDLMLDIIKELSISAIRGSQVNINMEDFTTDTKNPFPIFIRKSAAPDTPLVPNNHRSNQEEIQPQVLYPTLRKKAKRFLHVCVAKATSLPSNTEVPYVITELDEPHQRFRTEIAGNLNDPIWNETFTFELTKNSREILFEVWNNESFLGLGLVSVNELVLSEHQRMVIPLQGNPVMDNPGLGYDNSALFGGLLTVHFLITQTEEKSEAQKVFVEELGQENGETYSKIEEPEPESFRPSRVRQKRDFSRFKNRLSTSASATSLRRDRSNISVPSIQFSESTVTTPNAKRKSAIVEKFNDFVHNIRTMSADRIRSASQNRASTNLGVNGHSNGSQSDLSGVSSASNKTYITEESSLVLECVEKGVTKHYLIPYAQAKRGRFGKRGTKLHIYMDHIFVAQHLKGGTTCSACLANIPYRLGKQGYVCRNCNCTTHKPCHIKVTEHCENTTLHQMELLFMDSK